MNEKEKPIPPLNESIEKGTRTNRWTVKEEIYVWALEYEDDRDQTPRFCYTYLSYTLMPVSLSAIAKYPDIAELLLIDSIGEYLQHVEVAKENSMYGKRYREVLAELSDLIEPTKQPE